MTEPIKVQIEKLQAGRLWLLPVLTANERLVKAIMGYAGNEAAVKFITIEVQTLDQVKEFLVKVADKNCKIGNEPTWAICLTDGTPMGLVGLTFKEQKVADFGYAISPEFWGKGYMTEAVKCLCNWAFLTTSVETMVIRVYNGNTGSCKVAQKNSYRNR